MKHNVNIKCLDNGWLIRWTRNETDDERARRMTNQYTRLVDDGWRSSPEPKLNGTEIFTKHSDLIKRVKELTA